MHQYYDEIIRGTKREDALVIIQSLKESIGKSFPFLNYFQEIPVSYAAKLLNVENEMAEFEVHEYQAKVIGVERKALIFSQRSSALQDDVCAEAFYVSSEKKRVILCNFSYARIWSNQRRFVRVRLEKSISAGVILDTGVLQGNVIDISLGGAAITFMSKENLVPGSDLNLFLKLPDISNGLVIEVPMTASVVRVQGEEPPYLCILEFHQEKHSQRQIAYFANRRQVEIIKELKEFKNLANFSISPTQ